MGEILWRISQFYGKHKIILTRVPTFNLKSNLLKNVGMIIGVDTAKRVIMGN